MPDVESKHAEGEIDDASRERHREFAEKIKSESHYNYHDAIVRCLNNLHYDSVKYSGVCVGISMMSMLAVFTHEVDEFNARLEEIRAFDKALLQIKKDLLKKFGVEYIPGDRYQEQSFASLLDQSKIRSNSSELRNLEDEFNKKVEEELQKLSKNVSTNNTNTSINLRAFFDSVMINHYASRGEYQKITHAKNQDDVDATLPFTLNTKLEKLGGIGRAGQFSGSYNSHELMTYFRLLRETLKGCKFPVVLFLRGSMHAINISYDSDSDEWLFSDANQLPIKQIKIKNEDELASRVRTALRTEEIAVFGTEVFTFKKHSNEVLAHFEKTLKKENAWQAIHEITNQKANQTDTVGYSWLHEACKQKDIETVRSLLKQGANPNPINKDHRSILAVTNFDDKTGLMVVDTLLKYGTIPTLYDFIYILDPIKKEQIDKDLCESIRSHTQISEDEAIQREDIYEEMRRTTVNPHTPHAQAVQEVMRLCYQEKDIRIVEQALSDFKKLDNFSCKISKIVNQNEKSLSDLAKKFKDTLNEGYKIFTEERPENKGMGIAKVKEQIIALSNTSKLGKANGLFKFFGHKGPMDEIIELTHSLQDLKAQHSGKSILGG